MLSVENVTLHDPQYRARMAVSSRNKFLVDREIDECQSGRQCSVKSRNDLVVVLTQMLPGSFSHPLISFSDLHMVGKLRHTR